MSISAMVSMGGCDRVRLGDRGQADEGPDGQVIEAHHRIVGECGQKWVVVAAANRLIEELDVPLQQRP